MSLRISITTVILGITLALSEHLYAFQNQITHPALTKNSVNSEICVIDDYLKTKLATEKEQDLGE